MEFQHDDFSPDSLRDKENCDVERPCRSQTDTAIGVHSPVQQGLLFTNDNADGPTNQLDESGISPEENMVRIRVRVALDACSYQTKHSNLTFKTIMSVVWNRDR